MDQPRSSRIWELDALRGVCILCVILIHLLFDLSYFLGVSIHANPILLFIPCHRVIGKNGSLTGFSAGLDLKRFLLELERE